MLSRTRLARLLAEGAVRVNGAVARGPRRGWRRAIDRDRAAGARESHIAPEDITLTVVHEDDDLIVIDKPAGMVVHPAPGHARWARWSTRFCITAA